MKILTAKDAKDAKENQGAERGVQTCQQAEEVGFLCVLGVLGGENVFDATSP
jgi:hypothetical protein